MACPSTPLCCTESPWGDQGPCRRSGNHTALPVTIERHQLKLRFWQSARLKRISPPSLGCFKVPNGSYSQRATAPKDSVFCVSVAFQLSSRRKMLLAEDGRRSCMKYSSIRPCPN